MNPRAISGSQGFLPYFTDSGSNDARCKFRTMQQASGSIGVGTVPGAVPTPPARPRWICARIPVFYADRDGTDDGLSEAFFASDTYGPAIYFGIRARICGRFGKGGTGLYNPFGISLLEQMPDSIEHGKCGDWNANASSGNWISWAA